jgi:serine/threonine-protein kinase
MEPVPERIGRYVVEGLVGAGGMGRVYKAHDPDIRRTVAVKLISTSLMSSADCADYIRRFRREAEAAARCAHPNIIAIYDFALHEGQPFLAMEFVHGMSLRQRLDEESVMAVPDAIQVMLQVLDALGVAHQQGVIHQDIKPANILLTLQMQAKVADFGISRFVNTDVTNVSSSMGTPNYMSPEQCRGGGIDHRSDLFSVGATLFEMVAGERAFAGQTLTEVSHRIVNERLPLLPAAVRGAAPRLQFVLERAMGKQPEDRFDSGPEMAEALRQIVAGGRTSPEAEETRVSSLGAAASPPAAPPAGPPTGSPSSGPPSGPVDTATLQGLEQKLAGYVGPIARVMVRNLAARSASFADLCSSLADSVPEGERERFRRDIAPLMRTKVVTATTGERSLQPVTEAELERAQAVLTQWIGPIARVLVRRAARDAGSVDALWQALANHIDSPVERTQFLQRRHRDAP